MFIYFIRDTDMSGPASRQQWETAIKAVHSVLGLANEPVFVNNVFLDVRQR